MPFTPAHTAIVLPAINLRYLSATGLIVGSMAPDFEYFFKMSVNGVHGHTWPGLFYFDLPVTLVLSLLFHKAVKKNLIANLPPFLQLRFNDTLRADFVSFLSKNPIAFIISALLGSASHILWDGFTHGNGFFVIYFSFYDGAKVPFQGVDYPLWYALQHISTGIGLTILLVFIWLKPRTGSSEKPSLIYWILLLSISFLVLSVRFLVRPEQLELGNFVVSAISALCVGLLATGILPATAITSARQN
jgi:hypothetical protein